MLKNELLYRYFGSNHFDQKAKEKQVVRLIGRLEDLGFEMHSAPKAA